MVRPLSVLALAAVLSATVAASTEQSTPQRPPPRAKPAVARPAAPAAITPTTTPAPAPAPKPPPLRPATDVRLKTSYTQGAQVSQNVMYLQGARQRVEFPGVVAIDQCDLKRSVMLNTSAKRYRTQPYSEGPSAPAASPSPAAQQPQSRGGIVTVTTTLSDTLERQTMFGLEARRVKTVIIKQSSANACDKSPLKVEIDAWYVDLPEQSACIRPAASAPPPPASDPAACTDRVEPRAVGDVKLGFPVKATTTTTTGEGNKVDVTTSSQEVTELEITRLDHALFDVPSDYVEAKSSAEIVTAIASGGSLADALFGSTVDGSSTAAPKKPGTIRIGILEPINKTTRSLAMGALRQDLVSKFNNAPYEALPLAGTSPTAIEQQAARLECDYVLFTEITEVKTSKPGRLGGVMQMAGGGGGPAKDKHEVKLDYRLFAIGATQAPKFSGNAKASSGGFGIGSALRIAAFAGQMYMTMGMMGGMGMGMMNPMMGMSGAGGVGSIAGRLFDPRASAMSSMAMSFGGGMPGLEGIPGLGGDPSDNEMRETVSEALGNAAKSTMDQLRKK